MTSNSFVDGARPVWRHLPCCLRCIAPADALMTVAVLIQAGETEKPLTDVEIAFQVGVCPKLCVCCGCRAVLLASGLSSAACPAVQWGRHDADR